MPTYSYTHTLDEQRISKDCVDFDIFQKITEDNLINCPKCDEPVKKIITSAPMGRVEGGTPKFHA